MKLPSPSSRLTPLLALLVLSGCNSAYRAAFAQAKEAAIRGDFITAARAYRAACAAAPDDADACGRVPIFAEKGTDQALVAARPACDAGDLDRCLPPLLDAKDLIADHPEVNERLTKASQVQTERCSKWNPQGSVSIATAGLACLQSRAHQLPVPSYQALVSQRATELASRLSGLAATAHEKGTEGAAAVLLSAAQCIAPESGVAPRSQQARDAFLAQSAIPIAARISGQVPRRIAAELSDLCPRMAPGLPSWARCVESGTMPGQPDPLEVQVNALIQRVQETVSENINQVRYVSGQRWVPNPAYGAAEHDLQRAEKALAGAEHEQKGKDKACADASKTHDASCVGCAEPEQKRSPCDEAKEAGEEVARRRSAREAAGRHLERTPTRVSEDVYDTFSYSILTHHWASGYSFSLETNTPGAPQAAQNAGVLAFEDQEHVGFRPAGLEVDPLVVPSEQVYANAFLQQLGPHMLQAVQQDAQARAASRRAQCASLPADWSTSWVQCWAEAALWGNGAQPAPVAFLQELASSTGALEQPLCR